MKCKHEFKFLESEIGSKKLKIPDGWLFYCTKCLQMNKVFYHDKNIKITGTKDLR